MAVGDMVYHLADGPAAFPVGRIELRCGQALDGSLEPAWQRSDAVKESDTFGRRE